MWRESGYRVDRWKLVLGGWENWRDEGGWPDGRKERGRGVEVDCFEVRLAETGRRVRDVVEIEFVESCNEGEEVGTARSEGRTKRIRFPRLHQRSTVLERL